MIELNENFSLADLGNVKKEVFEILYNKNRVSSWDGHLYITPDKMYFIAALADMANRSVFDVGGAPKSWCIDLSEIASYGRHSLAGYQIVLKDGNKLLFSNVFRKLRNQLTESLDQHLGK